MDTDITKKRKKNTLRRNFNGVIDRSVKLDSSVTRRRIFLFKKITR